MVTSVVDAVGQSTLKLLGNSLLNALGHDGSVTTILGVCLATGRAGVVDLRTYVSILEEERYIKAGR